MCSPELSMLFPGTREKWGPANCCPVSAQAGNPGFPAFFFCRTPLHTCRRDCFISYKMRENKTAVCSFRETELSNTMGLGSSVVHSVFQPCAQKRAGVIAEAPRQAESTEWLALRSHHCHSHSSVVHQQKSICSLLKYSYPLFNQLSVKRLSLSLERYFLLFIHNSRKWRTYTYSEMKW